MWKPWKTKSEFERSVMLQNTNTNWISSISIFVFLILDHIVYYFFSTTSEKLLPIAVAKGIYVSAVEILQNLRNSLKKFRVFWEFFSSTRNTKSQEFRIMKKYRSYLFTQLVQVWKTFQIKSYDQTILTSQNKDLLRNFGFKDQRIFQSYAYHSKAF